MKVIDIDAIQSLTEPIELKMGGKIYKIDGLTKDVMDKVLESANENAEGESLHRSLAEQLSAFTGEPADNFFSLDVRQLQAAAKRIIAIVSEAGDKGRFRPKR